MDIADALKVLTALESGINPSTGEILDSESVFEYPDVIRALNRAIQAMQAETIASYRVSEKPSNAYNPWTPNEDWVLVNEFNSGKTFDVIANLHGRTEGAIRSRLVKLGLIENEFLRAIPSIM